MLKWLNKLVHLIEVEGQRNIRLKEVTLHHQELQQHLLRIESKKKNYIVYVEHHMMKQSKHWKKFLSLNNIYLMIVKYFVKLDFMWDAISVTIGFMEIALESQKKCVKLFQSLFVQNVDMQEIHKSYIVYVNSLMMNLSM